MYQKLSEETDQTPEAFYFDNLELRVGEMYYRNKSTPLTNKWDKLRSVGVIVEISSKERLPYLGLDIPRGKVMAQQAVKLNRMEEELPSASDVAKADDAELQEITGNADRSTEDVITQVKKVQLEERMKREKRKLMEFCDNQESNNDIREDIRKRIERLNDELKVRQESNDFLKGRLTSKIMGIKETIAKILDKDIGRKIRTLLREQGIMIASFLMAFGIPTSVLVKALLSGGVAAQGKGGDGNGKLENTKEWLRNKLKALARLLGRLDVKALLGVIIRWIIGQKR